MIWRIIQGDCLAALQRIPDQSVDAIITDPPYCSGGNFEAARQRAPGQGIERGRLQSGEVKWFVGDNMTTAGLVYLLRSVAFYAARLLVPGGSMLVFCDWRMWAMLAPALESGGLRLASMVVWDKGAPGLGRGLHHAQPASRLPFGEGVWALDWDGLPYACSDDLRA